MPRLPYLLARAALEQLQLYSDREKVYRMLILACLAFAEDKPRLKTVLSHLEPEISTLNPDVQHLYSMTMAHLDHVVPVLGFETLQFRPTHGAVAVERWYQPTSHTESNTRLSGRSYEGPLDFVLLSFVLDRPFDTF